MYGGFNQIGRTGILRVPAATNQALSALSCSKLLNPEFLLLYLNHNVGKWKRLAASSRKDPNITGSDVGFFKIEYPSLPEQQKIANFLSAVDSKINTLEKTHAGLNRYKRGLMQQLFSQARRFKDDNRQDFSDWEEKHLGDVFEWVKTNSLSREFLTHDSTTKVQNIHYGDIHTKFKAQFFQGSETVPYVSITAPIKPFNEDEYCQTGDLVIADASEDYADIGKTIEVMQVKNKTLVAGLHTYIARPIESQLVLGFSGYLFQSAIMRKQIMRMAQGVSVLGISKGNMDKLRFPLPHPKEQQKIAQALSTLDNKITAAATNITQLKTFKKGLLQQMFV